MFKVTYTNRKLGATIASINLPAITTCRADAPCKHDCYASHGTFKYKNVANCYNENLRMIKEDIKQAEKDILSQLPLMGFCRIHASGDFVNKEYFEMLIRIAKTAKHVKFMAFTKKYELVNEWIAEHGNLPKNFKIIFSAWYTDWTFENPYNLPIAYIYDKKTDNKIPKNAIPCGGSCQQCMACWMLKKRQCVVFNKHH